MSTKIYKTSTGYAAITLDPYSCVLDPRDFDGLTHIHMFQSVLRREHISDVDDGRDDYVPDPWGMEPREFYDALRELGAVYWLPVEYVGGHESAYGVADRRTYDADGVAYVTRDDLREWGREDMPPEEFRADVTLELAEYTCWANGDVYEVQTFDADGNPAGNYGEPCSGFYGEEQALDAAGVEFEPGRYVAPLETVEDRVITIYSCELARERVREYAA